MTSNLVTVILFKRPLMPFTVIMERFLSTVLSTQFMTPIPTLILNLASSWSLSWSSSGSSWFRRHPSQVISLSTDTAAVPAASCLGLALSASASGGALPPKLSESRLSSRQCVRHSFPQLSPLRPGCVPRGQWGT